MTIAFLSLWKVVTAAAVLPSLIDAASLAPDLMDPTSQPLFQAELLNPLNPSFIYNTSSGSIEVSVSQGTTQTGLISPTTGEPLSTPIWGYGTENDGYTWPGRTFVVESGKNLNVTWYNKIPIEDGYLLTGVSVYAGESVVDESFHWCYSLKGYTNYTIKEHGTPITPHLHGGHQDDIYDGNPEYFFTPDFLIKGPQWTAETYIYDNSQPAACLWYHDHALGITRLNVYAGLAGFYIVRDDQDTGLASNPLQLPAYPYELPLMIQDRMFKENGELFYPAFGSDPYYKDFIEGEGAIMEEDQPSAMAEFFGDHMTVNGKIWPKMNVEPRKYRLRILNGCDSRFLALSLLATPELNATGVTPVNEIVPSLDKGVNMTRVPFYVIGGDQGFSETPTSTTLFVSEPGSRYDIIVDFADFTGMRVIMTNTGGDEPFGGTIPGPQTFDLTDRIMAFDVTLPLDPSTPNNWSPPSTEVVSQQASISPDRIRRVGLFEGHDQFGRLQPLLGTVDPATDMDGNPIYYPDSDMFVMAGLAGEQMNGTAAWHYPTTENVRLGDVEEWEIWNLTPDAHPIHLHLVHFDVISRHAITFDSAGNEYGEIEPEDLPANGDGTYTTDYPMIQHDGSTGQGYFIVNPTKGKLLSSPKVYIESHPKDVVVALPGQITTIRAKFDKPGRFNWHCHILSHEDHEMMRIFHVGPLPEDQLGGSGPANDDPVMNNTGSSGSFGWSFHVLTVSYLLAIFIFV